jgi:hypothetical protein
MQPSKFGVEPLANHLAIAHYDRANERIRANPAASGLRKLQSTPEMRSIRGCGWGIHATD